MGKRTPKPKHDIQATLLYLAGNVDVEVRRRMLGQTRDDLKERAEAMMINYDLTTNSPSLNADRKEQEIEGYAKVFEEMAWRLQRLEDQLAELPPPKALPGNEQLAVFPILNRAARRQMLRRSKKEAERSASQEAH